MDPLTAESSATPARRARALPDWVAAGITFLASGSVLVLEVVGLRLIAPYVGITLQTSATPGCSPTTPLRSTSCSRRNG